MKIEKITRKQWAVAFLILSIPLVWWGYVNFMYKGSNSAVMAMAISLCLTSGICCVVGGIYMLFTKEKGRGESLLASQTKVEDPLVEKEIINQPTKKVNEMATSVEMMQREKELEARRKELEGLLEEVRHEETELEQALQTKGWIKKDGEWKVPQSK